MSKVDTENEVIPINEKAAIIEIAKSILYIYEQKFPNDKRVSDYVYYAEKYYAEINNEDVNIFGAAHKKRLHAYCAVAYYDLSNSIFLTSDIEELEKFIAMYVASVATTEFLSIAKTNSEIAVYFLKNKDKLSIEELFNSDCHDEDNNEQVEKNRKIMEKYGCNS
jgi:hypothetical protein